MVSPDVMIVVETWMDKAIKILNSEYQVLQTSQNHFQGVWIIARKSIERRLENEDNWSSCILVSSIRKDNKTITYMIGVYRKTEKKGWNHKRSNKNFKENKKKI